MEITGVKDLDLEEHKKKVRKNNPFFLKKLFINS